MQATLSPEQTLARVELERLDRERQRLEQAIVDLDARARILREEGGGESQPVSTR